MVALLLVLLAASPSPSPTPFLRTIVTVRSSAFCGALAAHVNAAIDSAVGNDQTLGTTVVTLRSGDLAASHLRRMNEMQRLSLLSDSIYKQYRIGENEVKELRALGAKTTDPGEQAAVKAAADALGGALYRQHLVQRDLDGFIAFLSASDMRSDMAPESLAPPAHAGLEDNASGMDPGAGTTPFWTPEGMRTEPLTVGRESSEDDVRMAAAAADDFSQRMPAILKDEMTAGEHIAAAGNRC